METISRKDLSLAWLAGIIDADGCISFARLPNNRRTEPTWHLRPYTSITTTCSLTKDHLVQMYQELEIPVHVSVKPNSSQNRNGKPIYCFQTAGMKRSKQLLPLILPYLVTKHREAELILEFIEIRDRLFATKTHDSREIAILEEVGKIKATRNKIENPQRLYARLR